MMKNFLAIIDNAMQNGWTTAVISNAVKNIEIM